MKKQLIAITLAAVMAAGMTGCGSSSNSNSSDAANKDVSLDYKSIDLETGDSDLKADLKVITHRTDLVDTTFEEYAQEFQKLYPNVTISFEGITNYADDMTTRLTSGDWGDICMIPTTVNKSEFGTYFEPICNYDDMKDSYEFLGDKMFDGKVYGIASMGNAMGIVYNKSVFEEAGISELPTTPDAFLDDLKQIKDKTDAIPLYTNYAAGWTLTAWDSYIGGTATGDADFMNNTIVHQANPFSKRSDETGPYAVYNTLYEAVSEGLTEDDPTTTDWEGCKSQINNGKIGCMVLGSWAIIQMQEAGDHADDIGYMPFPITVDGKQYASASADYAYGINVNSTADEKKASAAFIKWLTEKSGYAYDQGGIPIVKGETYPETLSAFTNVTLVMDNPTPTGEEDLYANINNGSELSLNSDPTHVARIIESAIDHNETMDEIADSWNEAWTSAQESNGVTPQ